jgi:hypothetical protein
MRKIYYLLLTMTLLNTNTVLADVALINGDLNISVDTTQDITTSHQQLTAQAITSAQNTSNITSTINSISNTQTGGTNTTTQDTSTDTIATTGNTSIAAQLDGNNSNVLINVLNQK